MNHECFLSKLNENLTTSPVDDLKKDDLIAGITSGDIKFLKVVESIQGVLTNENVGIREKGIDFLSWTMSQLSVNLFNGSEIAVIANFYCDCLNGHHNLIPSSVKGLQALVKMKNISREDIIKILVNLFQHVNCQTQLQADRYNIYSLLKHVIENHIEDIKPMGPDFVFGLISFIEGEADPCCLLLIFNFLPFFIKNFDLGHLAEEMFEVLSCYFPVDFNSAAKDNIMITREDLADGLIQCLSVSNVFSDECMSLIFDKLDSTFKTAKIDSYKLLQECCKSLKVENVEKHLNQLWKCLVKDVLPGSEKQVCDAGLLALASVVELLSKDESHLKILFTFLEDILTTVKSLISRIDENMFQPAVRVLMASSARSKPATAKILCQLKPYFNIDSSKTLIEKKIILSSLLPFVKCCQVYKMVDTEEPEVLSSYLDMVNFYIGSTTCDDFDVRKLAFLGVLELLSDLEEDLRKILYELVVENIKQREDIKTSEEFLKVWRKLATDHQAEFYNVLSNSFPTDSSHPQLPRILWAFSLVADLSSFTGFIVPILVNVIVSSENYVIGLESLLNGCRCAKKNESSSFYRSIHEDHNILERLFFWWMESRHKIRNSEILPLVSEISALVTRNQTQAAQQTIVDKFSGIFLNGSSLLNGCGDSVSGVLLEQESAQAVSILEAILGSVTPEVTIPMLSTFREKLTSLALMSSDESIRLSSSRLLASIVNKSKDSDLPGKIFEDIYRQLEEGSDDKLKLNSAFLLNWVVKGVILGGGSEKWISSWLELLERRDVGKAIADGFQTVIQEDKLYLNLESHCIVRVLYRQRLFGYFPKLTKSYETCEESVKTNYLLAMVRLLQGLPIHLIQTEILSIIPLLVRCLDEDKTDVLVTSLEIIKELLENREMIFSDHIQSFVPRLLKLSRFESSMRIRINALNCIYLYGFYPTVVLLPVKNQVIQELESCLDDKKRLVRKEAVRARCRWFLVGAPGEDILAS